MAESLSDDSEEEEIEYQNEFDGDMNEVSSSEESGSELELEDNAEQPASKKSAPESFSKAVTSILSSHLKAHSRADPILVRSKKTARDLEASRLEAKAKRALIAEKKAKIDKERIRTLSDFAALGNGGKDAKDDAKEGWTKMLEHEKKLKRTAMKGVVSLFNAIQTSQKSFQGDTPKNALEEEKATELSKEKFLDLIRSG